MSWASGLAAVAAAVAVVAAAAAAAVVVAFDAGAAACIAVGSDLWLLLEVSALWESCAETPSLDLLDLVDSSLP